MDPLTLGAIASGVQVVGGLLGSGASAGDRNSANEQYQQILKDYLKIKTPSVDQQKLILALQQSVGNYNPQQETAENLATNYYNNVQADQGLNQTRLDQLDMLKQLSQTGMTPEEQAQANKLQRMQAAEAQSKVADIERNAAQTGTSSSGMSLLAKLQAAQSARNQGATDKDNLLAQMMNRKLQAGGQASNLAGQLDELQYNRAMGLADSKMGLDKFNLQNRASTQQRNVSGLNEAQRYNLTNQQNIANNNVDLQNKQQQYNKALLQQEFDNKRALTGDIANARRGSAATFQSRANATAGQISGAASGISQGIGAYGQQQIDQKRMDLFENSLMSPEERENAKQWKAFSGVVPK